jgi:hypothetical protein
MTEVVGLCIACAHYKALGLYERDEHGQTPRDPHGLCFECRDAALSVRGPCDTRCFCASRRSMTIRDIAPEKVRP